MLNWNSYYKNNFHQKEKHGFQFQMVHVHFSEFTRSVFKRHPTIYKHNEGNWQMALRPPSSYPAKYHWLPQNLATTSENVSYFWMIFQIENLHRNSICYAFGCFFCTSVCHGVAIHFPQLLGSLSHCSLSASTCEQQRGLHMIFEDRGDIKKTDHSNDDSTAHLS